MPSLTSLPGDPATFPIWLVSCGLAILSLAAFALFRVRKLHRDALRELRNYRELIENLSEGIYRSSIEGKQLSANRALVSLNGYDNEEELLLAVSDIAKEWYVDPERRDQFRALLKRDGVVTDFISEIYRHKTRERIWITESARIVSHEKTGQPLYYEGSVREITETIKRLRLEERFQKLMSEVPGSLFQFTFADDGSSSVDYLSPGFTRITGIGAAEMIETSSLFRECMFPEDNELFHASLMRSLETLEPWEIEFRFTRSGELLWLRLSATPERIGDHVTFHGYACDISQRKRNEMAIERLAFYDALTNLPNRRMFMQRIESAVVRCQENETCGAVLYIDLDNFKSLNDTRGHDIGDDYLIQMADRLLGCVNEGDTVARIGGDEFVIIVESDSADRAACTRAAILVAQRVLEAAGKEFCFGEFTHKSSASVGIVVFDRDDTQTKDIIRNADIAMYQAKAAGRDGIALFDAATPGEPLSATKHVTENVPYGARLRA